MATTTAEELRIRVALQHPDMTSAEVRREAERVAGVLDAIQFEDDARAQFAAQQAEDEREQAAVAQRRREAFADAQSIVARSHPGWDGESIGREADRLVAENERALAELAVKEALNG